MIISVGEILLDDILGDYYPGGAPFNVAVSSFNAGSDVFFFGSVGNDKEGSLLLDYVSSYGLDPKYIRIDKERKTTKAIVSLDEKGERSFRFDRGDGTDSILPYIDDETLRKAKILHIGSLGLCYKENRDYMTELISRAKSLGILVSFDMNYRSDIFLSEKEAMDISKEFILLADIVKLSEDEASLLGDEFISSLNDKRLFITRGEKGSSFLNNGLRVDVSSKETKVIDTVGAGDAFFGEVLALLDQEEKDIEKILLKGNENARKCLGHKGALPIIEK